MESQNSFHLLLTLRQAISLVLCDLFLSLSHYENYSAAGFIAAMYCTKKDHFCIFIKAMEAMLNLAIRWKI